MLQSYSRLLVIIYHIWSLQLVPQKNLSLPVHTLKLLYQAKAGEAKTSASPEMAHIKTQNPKKMTIFTLRSDNNQTMTIISPSNDRVQVADGWKTQQDLLCLALI